MSLESEQKRLVTIRANIARAREAKKKDNERFRDRIKSAKGTDAKASLRKSKISTAAMHDRRIESLKKQVISCRASIKRERERLRAQRKRR